MSETVEEDAVKAAEQWLTLVDAGRYVESWENSAAYLRKAVTKERWEESLNPVREPLGEVVSRSVKSAEYADSLPGAPDGDYVVIQFQTSFENKNVAVETVTPMKDSDGVWRVAGYFIR
jgi:hypothetical protein